MYYSLEYFNFCTFPPRFRGLAKSPKRESSLYFVLKPRRLGILGMNRGRIRTGLRVVGGIY